MGNPNYANGFEVALHPNVLELPNRWRRPRLVFVNSMSDLFHQDVPDTFIREVFATMEACHRHTFQVLTKRTARLAELAGDLPWPTNVWMGVTVENAAYIERIRDLLSVPAHKKFVSFEPLLGSISALDLHGVDWVIVGGESGPHARTMREEWVVAIRDECDERGIPFFFKQWGGTNKKKNGRLLDGRTWDDMPMA
jgi:protein gp37